VGVFVLGPWLRDHVEPRSAHTLGFLPFFQGPARFGEHADGGVVLAIMVLPYISAVCTDVFRAVPQTQREAALRAGRDASGRWCGWRCCRTASRV
jgi:phosphate transport system permease protein